MEKALEFFAIIVMMFASYQLGEIHGAKEEKTSWSKVISCTITATLSIILYMWSLFLQDSFPF